MISSAEDPGRQSMMPPIRTNHDAGRDRLKPADGHGDPDQCELRSRPYPLCLTCPHRPLSPSSGMHCEAHAGLLQSDRLETGPVARVKILMIAHGFTRRRILWR